MVEHRSITRRFHVVFCLAVAASSAQLLDICPLSSSVLLFHVNAGRPLSLRPTVVDHKASTVIPFWVFLSVWPIQFHLRFNIAFFMSSWLVRFQRSWLLIFSDQNIFSIFLKQPLINAWISDCNFSEIAQVSLAYSNTDLHYYSVSSFLFSILCVVSSTLYQAC